MTNRNIIFGVLVILSTNAYASEWSIDIGCFTSSGKKPINIKLSDMYFKKDNARIGYVKYENSHMAIPISLVKEYSEILAEDRPYQYTTVWNEMIQGKFNGSYTVISQGARYYGLTYINTRGKQVDFEENLSAYDVERKDCIWK
ncbi:hypothetical protein ID858_03785 [Xenorhabdus sp. DI]|uniref:hypothetical protein n=1 Tax=Xenorhabdus doucetiae TaxID=351671 RepID=UPI0019957524|nr:MULTISPECIES: hypothetical protein [unclassified Xenorhabdus]MBD2785208.1 hypothetical protein [Xenorhabdus sp. 3]MBD2787627.1 hypothetical protein [Xenorhabdus sp. DI]